MTVSRGVSAILISIVGIIIILVAVFAIASMLGSNAPVKPIIAKTIQLKQATEPVEKAKLITDLDDLITQTENKELKDQWDRMMGCLSTSCPDEAFLDMVLVTVANYEQELPESALLINIIATAKYWGNQEHLLEFSKALSMANDQVDELQNKNARKQWQQIVECNGTCPEKNDLFFNIIETIAQ